MEETLYVTVEDLASYFNFQQISGDQTSLQRKITLADTNRPGLELAGFFNHSQHKRLIILGDKEIAYIETMSEGKQKKSFQFLTNEDTPAIIITKNHPCPSILQKIAKRKNFPIFISNALTYRLIVDIVAYLDEKLAVSDSLHGVLISIYGKGVLIRAESGMGKSEIALELIKRGHFLVADDRVDCFRIHNHIVGKAPELLEGMLEIRGIGIINVQRMFGVSTVISEAEVSLVICLEKWADGACYDRVGIEEKKFERILDVDIPKIVIPIREGRSMGVIIESAVMNHLLSTMGLDSGKEFEQRVIDYIDRNEH